MKVYPFQINKTFNEKMNCYELMIQIGGIQTKEDVEAFADVLAEFIGGRDAKRVSHDD